MDVSLTDREASLMEVLWERGPSTVAEVRDHLADDLAYTTVRTIRCKLVAKGCVTHGEAGRAPRYSAVVHRDLGQRSPLQALKRKLFRGTAELLLTRLARHEKLTSTEIERIRALLEQRSKGRKR